MSGASPAEGVVVGDDLTSLGVDKCRRLAAGSWMESVRLNINIGVCDLGEEREDVTSRLTTRPRWRLLVTCSRFRLSRRIASRRNITGSAAFALLSGMRTVES